MSNNPRTSLEEKISAAAPAALSPVEEAALFEAVRAKVASRPSLSPFYSPFFTNSKTMIPIALALMLLLGAGGTVAASDSARPGDLLFPIDRAVEDFRFSIANEDEKQELRVKFAKERLAEFNEIAGSDDLSGNLDVAEADIFTNETVVKLEAGSDTATFTTDANTREEIIDVIHDRYGFSTTSIDAVLTVDTEDRESTADDRNEDEARNTRLENALDVLGDFIEKNRDAASTSPEALEALALIENRLLGSSAFFPKEVRAKVENDRARYEVRGENGQRVRVEVKDGEVRVKTNGDSSGKGSGRDDDEDEDDDRDEDRNRVGTSTPSGFLQVEADIFTDTTIVKVELKGRTTVFTTDADTRSEIIDEVQDRFEALSESEIDAALDLETEDRASRAQDLDENSSSDDDEDDDDDSSGHHSGRDSDDDEDDDDDDSSGHGGSDDDDDEDEDDDDSSGKGSGKDD